MLHCIGQRASNHLAGSLLPMILLPSTWSANALRSSANRENNSRFFGSGREIGDQSAFGRFSASVLQCVASPLEPACPSLVAPHRWKVEESRKGCPREQILVLFEYLVLTWENYGSSQLTPTCSNGKRFVRTPTSKIATRRSSSQSSAL
jgi:hypothetical protein